MYSDASFSGDSGDSGDHPTDTTMTALYRQLDDHELGDDARFDVNVGLRHLLTRIQHEATSPEPAVITSGTTRPRFSPFRLQAIGARGGRRRYLGQHLAAAVAIVLILAICRAIFLSGATAPDSAHPFPRTVPTAPPIAVWPLELRAGQSQMSGADMKGLATEISMIRETPTTRLKVIGYASGPGTPAALAFRRAENVAGFLEKQGISASMIQVQVVLGVSPFLGTNSDDTVIVTWSTLPSPSNSASASAVPTTSSTPTPTPATAPTPTTSTVSTPTPTTPTTPTPTPTTSTVSTPTPTSTPTPATSTTTAPAVSTSPALTPASTPAPATSTLTLSSPI
jgi:hypothetical protein